MLTLLFFVSGLVALVAGTELLVRGASKLALSFGISPLVVGLAVVAFGTSAPEMAVSVQSAWSGKVDIALGNVVGSNIFNVLFILGVSALITPLLGEQQLIRQEAPIMVGIMLLLLLALAWDGGISGYDAALLFGLMLAYTAYVLLAAQRHDALSTFGFAMTTFVLPLTALTLIVVSWRAWRSPTFRKP